MNTQNQGLTPEKLQLFIAGLTGMSKEEAGKAKLLFIKNEIAEYRMLKTQHAAFWKMQGCFAIVPIFWPIMRGQKILLTTALDMHREQLQNAFDVWRGDLGHHAAELESQLRELD